MSLAHESIRNVLRLDSIKVELRNVEINIAHLLMSKVCQFLRESFGIDDGPKCQNELQQQQPQPANASAMDWSVCMMRCLFALFNCKLRRNANKISR